MRTTSAAWIKGKSRGLQVLQKIPRPGTRLREIYDLFYDNRGIPVHFSTSHKDPKMNNGTNLIQLRDLYGMDIRRLKKNTYILAGEWFDTEYKDYIAERMNEAKSKLWVHPIDAPPDDTWKWARSSQEAHEYIERYNSIEEISWGGESVNVR